MASTLKNNIMLTYSCALLKAKVIAVILNLKKGKKKKYFGSSYIRYISSYTSW